jgi:VanZ family protein
MPFPIIWLRRWGPSLLMMALIFTASGTAGSDLPKFGIWDFFVKKGGHLIGYALLGASYAHGLVSHKGMKRSVLLAAIVLAGLYAVTDEFHQSFTPGRTPSAVDVGIDTIGAALGVGIWTWIRSLLAV